SSGISNVVSGTTPDGVPPAEVLDLAAVTGTMPASVKLTWTHTGDDGQEGSVYKYDLRYSASPINQSNFEEAVRTQSQPSGGLSGTIKNFTVSSLPEEKELYFAMRAEDNENNLSGVSNSASARTPEVPPARVTDLEQLDASLSTVTVSWTAPGDNGENGTASGYDLRYSSQTITDANFVDAATVPTNTPGIAGTLETATLSNLSQNTVYYVALKTVDARGNWSLISTVLAISTVDDEPPGEISDLVAETGTSPGTVRLNWSAVGDDGLVGTANLYEAKYSTVPIDMSNWSSATAIDGMPNPRISGTNESFTVRNLEGEIKYYFAIRALDEEGNAGQISTSVSAWTPAVPPSSIVSLSGEVIGAGSVNLSWTAPGDDGDEGTATQYDIRYSKEAITWYNFESAHQVTEVPDPAQAGTPQTVTVEGLEESVTYWFAMVAIDDRDAKSGLSNSISLTTFDETAPAAPVSFNASTPDSSSDAIEPISAESSSELCESLDAMNAIDGDEESVWVSDGSADSVEETLTIDLGEIFNLDRVKILPDDGYLNLFPRNFTISVSTDKTSWTEVLNTEEFEASAATWLTFGFSQESARYVRITSYEPATSFFGLHYTVLAEIEVLKARPTSGRARLAWVAPGDDEHVGKADHYEVYRHTGLFNESTLDTTTLVGGAPTPAMSGALESMETDGLQGETRYYWAVRAVDEAGNIGSLSEISTQTTSEIPPAVVSNLSVSNTEMYSATLNWTAPGDDGEEGRAAEYEMRYAPWSLTIENFPLATEVEGLPAPLDAGESQSVTVDGLEAGTLYRFAVLTRDEAGAVSYLSNVALVETEPEPDLVPPDPVIDLHGEIPQSGGEPITGTAIDWSTQQLPNFSADMLTDSSHTTMWSSVARETSGEEWVEIDLGTTLPVDRVRIWPSDDFLDLFPPSIEIRVSPDGLAWSTVFSKTDYIAETGIALEGAFPVVPARYVEFVATDLASNENGYYYAVVSEVEILSAESDPSTIVVSWTAPGDDGAVGQASSYDLRIGECPYDHQSAASVLTDEPRAAGQSENVRIGNLEPGDYCLGLKTADEAGNESTLSNTVFLVLH
ncbi:MAG: hypothetical protein GY854_03980, partial [Deltaproteobacteria bacterium]|nr:hypothetical protein [Deltaproteobacteria bacterium]